MKRTVYIVLMAVIVFAGLWSRRVAWVPAGMGDALWAMLMYCLWRVVFIRRRLRWVALCSLFACYAVEFSQLLRWPWLVSFRSTAVGHLLLGQGFLWTDLVAYTAGIVFIYTVTHCVAELVWLRRSE